MQADDDGPHTGRKTLFSVWGGLLCESLYSLIP